MLSIHFKGFPPRKVVILVEKPRAHLEGTAEIPGQFDQLLLHGLADWTSVAVQGHAVHQQEAAAANHRGGMSRLSLGLANVLLGTKFCLMGIQMDSVL